MAHTDFQQEVYLPRFDDGTEITATSRADVNSRWVQPADIIFRLRVVIRKTTAGAGNFHGKLQAAINGSGWFDVTAASQYIQGATSVNVADGDPTTQQISTGDFVAGVVCDDGSLPNLAFTGIQSTEFEFVLQAIGVDLSGEHSLSFRIVENSGHEVDAYLYDISSCVDCEEFYAIVLQPEVIEIIIEEGHVV